MGVEVSPLPDVPRDDHVVAQQKDPVEVHGPPGHPEQQVLSGVGAEQGHLRLVLDLLVQLAYELEAFWH